MEGAGLRARDDGRMWKEKKKEKETWMKGRPADGEEGGEEEAG